MGDMNFGVNIVPTTDSTFTLGNSVNHWDGQYIVNIQGENIASTVDSSHTASLAVKATNANITSNLYGVAYYNNTSGQFASTAAGTTKQVLLGMGSDVAPQFGTITSPYINDNAIVEGKIEDGAVTTNKILNGNVTGAKIAGTTITSANLANSAVTSVKLANSAVTSAKLANDAVTTDKILNATVTSAKLANGAVTSDKLADNAVTLDKISNSSIYIGALSFSLGSTVSPSNLRQELNLSKALTYKGTVDTLPNINSNDIENGDVYIALDGVYIANLESSPHAWDKLGDNIAYKLPQEGYSIGNSSINTSRNFLCSLSQNSNGNVTVTTADVPTGSSSQLGVLKIGTGLVGNSGTVSLDFDDTVTAQQLGAIPSAGLSNSPSRVDHVHLLTHAVYTETIQSADSFWSSGTAGPMTASGFYHTFDYSSDLFFSTLASGDIIDVNASVQSGYENMKAALNVSDISQGIIVWTDTKPAGNFTIKISLDKSL